MTTLNLGLTITWSGRFFLLKLFDRFAFMVDQDQGLFPMGFGRTYSSLWWQTRRFMVIVEDTERQPPYDHKAMIAKWQ